jgi:3-hydroxybutyrate dehydrogenase
MTGSCTTANLRDQVIIVTGANGALGAATVRKFVAAGAKVVPTDLAGEEMVLADISTAEGNRAVIDHTIDRYGRLDGLVLNAGVQHMSPIPDFGEEDWNRLIAIMLTGPFLAVKYAWPHLTAQPQSRVLVTASTSSYVAERYKAAYVAAKHGVLGLLKVVALEGASHGLTANAVAPAWMRTPLVENQVGDRMDLLGLSRTEVIADMVNDHAVKRFVEVDEVADVLAFLASPSASAITGTCIPVDLGALA